MRLRQVLGQLLQDLRFATHREGIMDMPVVDEEKRQLEAKVQELEHKVNQYKMHVKLLQRELEVWREISVQ